MATSEMRRAAKALVAIRTESFESLHDAAESRRRVARALEQAGRLRATVHRGAWRSVDGKTVYEATFSPAPRVSFYLQALAIGLALLLGASAWMLVSGAGTRAARFLVPLFALLAFVAMPLAVIAMASQREAEESRVLRAIRVALRDEDAKYPPPQRWKDED
jgi:hypothetical protein